MPYLYLVLGLVGLYVGAELAVRGALGLAQHWHWPPWLAGFLLVATGTSLPELFVSGAAAPSHPSLGWGNVMGSNAFNVGMVLGLALLVQGRRPLPLKGIGLAAVLPMLLGSAALFFVLDRERMPGLSGPVLLAGYAWIALVLYRARPTRAWTEVMEALPESEQPRPGQPVWILAALTVAGFGVLALGADGFLAGALQLAADFGWEEGFAGFLVAAVATSAPELLTCFRAMRHGHAEAVLGNVAGSNAFNLFVVGGVVAIRAGAPLEPVALRPQVLVNLGAALFLIAPAVLHSRKGRGGWSLPAWVGAALIAAYLVSAWLVSGDGAAA